MPVSGQTSILQRSCPDAAEQTAVAETLGSYSATNQPVIPVTTASRRLEYSAQHCTGRPTQCNPYGPGQPSGTNLNGGGTNVVAAMHVTLRSWAQC